jgi:hypothetical protein
VRPAGEADRPVERPAARGERPEGAFRPEGGVRGDGQGRPEGMPPGIVRRPVGFDQIDRMREWLEVVERYGRMARNPVDAGIAAVVTANDLLRARGPEAAIEYFTKMLAEVKNDAVQRAIRLQLVDLYKAAGQPEKALDQLQSLMTAAPVEAGR